MKIYSSHKVTLSDQRVIEALLGEEKNISWLVTRERPEAGTGNRISDWDYICNPDATIRWIYPGQSRRPHFLTTYNSQTQKAKLYRSLAKLLFKTGLNSILRSGRLFIEHPEGAQLGEFPLEIASVDYAIFTGTVGPNRKAVLALGDHGEVLQFGKVAVGKQARKRLKQEMEALETVKGFSLTKLRAPAAFDLSSRATTVENIKTRKRASDSRFSSLHEGFVLEMLEKTQKNDQNTSNRFFKEIDRRLESMQAEPQLPGMERMLLQLRAVQTQCQALSTHLFTYSHGDFTPWNMYVGKERLHLYDWEMAGVRPALYDLFHYHFQLGILVKRQNYEEIRGSIADVLAKDHIRSRLSGWDLDIRQQLRMYLLENISSNLLLFQEQGVLHPQAWWLMRTWALALENENSLSLKNSCRQHYLSDLSKLLQKENYAIMRGEEEVLSKLSPTSDLDILVDLRGQQAISLDLDRHPLILKKRVFRQSFMQRLEIHFMDGGFLSLDLISDIRRKALRMMDAKEVLKRAVIDDFGLRRLCLQDQMEYAVLFYGLNGHLIPERITELFMGLSLDDRRQFALSMSEKYGVDFGSLRLDRYSDGRPAKLRRALKGSSLNGIMGEPGRQFTYIRDLLRRLLHGKGMVITFSGVDGAGKSTVLNASAEAIGATYRRKVKVLRHRPSLLPILSSIRHGRKKAEMHAAERLPRQGNNRNFLSSLLRFYWYYFDYLVGQWYVWARYERRGYVVLYDRYFYDMIADPERSNFRLPRPLVRMSGRLIRKPTLNFLLTADEQVILQRKAELKAGEIDMLTKRYRNLFVEMAEAKNKARFIVLHNKSIQTSIDRILQAYRQAL